jgi:hypothetical protein
MTPTQAETMVAIYELAGAATVPAVARRLGISAWAAAGRIRILARDGWVRTRKPRRMVAGKRGIPPRQIVPSAPAAIDMLGGRWRLVQLAPPRKETG